MAAPNGMAPRPTNANANAMAQMETFLRQLPVELQTQMLNLPLDQKINFARQYMAAKKAQSNGVRNLIYTCLVCGADSLMRIFYSANRYKCYNNPSNNSSNLLSDL
jgi:hypothetical protein